MNLELHYGQTELAEALQTFLERRLQFALAAYSPQLGMVTVRVDDGKENRETRIKRCEVKAELIPAGEIMASETNVDLYVAIDRAVRRLVFLLKKETDMKRRSNRQHGTCFRRSPARLPRNAEGGLYASIS